MKPLNLVITAAYYTDIISLYLSYKYTWCDRAVGPILPCTTNWVYYMNIEHTLSIQRRWSELCGFLLIIIINLPFMCMFSEVWQQSRYNTLTIPLLLAILGRTSSRHTDINQAACAHTHTHTHEIPSNRPQQPIYFGKPRQMHWPFVFASLSLSKWLIWLLKEVVP